MPTSPCACGRPRRRAIAPPVELGDDRVSVRLDGVGVLACERGHAEVVDDDLANHLVERLRGQVLVAGRRRLRRQDTCGHCGEVLALRPRVTETPVVDDVGVTVVALTPVAPMVRCGSCGREQYVAEVADRLADLVPRAVAAIARRPPATSA